MCPTSFLGLHIGPYVATPRHLVSITAFLYSELFFSPLVDSNNPCGFTTFSNQKPPPIVYLFISHFSMALYTPNPHSVFLCEVK